MMLDGVTIGSPHKLVCTDCGSDVWKPYLRLVKKTKDHPNGLEFMIICAYCPMPGYLLGRRESDV